MRILPQVVAITLILLLYGYAAAAEPRDVAFQAEVDGTEQRYVLVLPEEFDPQAAHSVLVALHGHGSDRWQFVKDGRDECRAAREAAARERLIYVSPDYRAKTSWMGPAAEADLLQILAELRGKYRVDQVIVCGGSMGGTAALTFAALHPDQVDGVVAMNGTANLVEYEQFQDAIAASFGGSKQQQPEEYRRRSAELHAERLTMPIALTTGGQDRLVPPDSVLRLAQSLEKQQRPVRLIHRPDGGHSTNLADAQAAFDFVFAQLAAAKAKPLLPFSAPTTIVCLGDSVTGVYYHTGGRRAYPEMLEIAIQQALPQAEVKVVNAGISGNTTKDGLARLDRDVLRHKPNLVTISFGLNDMTRIPEGQFGANLQALVERCRAAEAQVVLCTPNAVVSTAARPVEKLVRYCEIIRHTAGKLNVPLCDQYAAGEAARERDARGWRLTLSDEIHPNMDGHKRMAEELCRTITGKNISLAKVGPPPDFLAKTRVLLQQGKPVKVLAMPPFDALIGPALQQLHPHAVVEVTPWPTAGKSLLELEQAARQLVRPMKPNLVILALPATATVPTGAAAEEKFAHAYAWTMNVSLSFGQQEWDCVVVHPSVVAPDVSLPQGELIRQLVRAQDLTLIDRPAGDRSSVDTLFTTALQKSH